MSHLKQYFGYLRTVPNNVSQIYVMCKPYEICL